MRRGHVWIRVLFGAASTLLAAGALAVESDPLPVPKGTSREQAVTAYNDGVKLVLDKRYAAAQQKLDRKSVV